MSSSSSKPTPTPTPTPIPKRLGSLLFLAAMLGSLIAPAGCDDPVTPPADDGKVKAVRSTACGADKTASAPKGFQSQTKLVVKGIDRTYDWLVPDAHDGRHPVPVVFVFHGDGGSGVTIRDEFKIEPITEGKAIMVYPDGTPPARTWDLDRGPENNVDIFFFDQILANLADNYCIDTARVFVAGVSRGAYFANQLGCYRGGSIRAIASHSGGGPSGQDYDGNGQLECPEKPVAALIVHGTADTEVPLSEGQASLAHWDQVNGCRNGGLETFDPAPCKKQLNCAQDRPVIYCEIPDLKHAVWSEGPRASWNLFTSL